MPCKHNERVDDMIATLRGTIIVRTADKAVVDVSGVGYEVFLSHDNIARLPGLEEEVFLHIHTHVREDAFILYGFLEDEEKQMFLILKTVSGIGPKLALSILSGMKVGELSMAIGAKDIGRLTGLQGVGKKTAERLCVDLKDKVGHLTQHVSEEDLGEKLEPASSSVQADALSAFVNLGYPDPIARKALIAVKKRVGDEVFLQMKLEELLREGLRALA